MDQALAARMLPEVLLLGTLVEGRYLAAGPARNRGGHEEVGEIDAPVDWAKLIDGRICSIPTCACSSDVSA